MLKSTRLDQKKNKSFKFLVYLIKAGLNIIIEPAFFIEEEVFNMGLKTYS